MHARRPEGAARALAGHVSFAHAIGKEGPEPRHESFLPVRSVRTKVG
jgi:hypothetical protein